MSFALISLIYIKCGIPENPFHISLILTKIGHLDIFLRPAMRDSAHSPAHDNTMVQCTKYFMRTC